VNLPNPDFDDACELFKLVLKKYGKEFYENEFWNYSNIHVMSSASLAMYEHPTIALFTAACEGI